MRRLHDRLVGNVLVTHPDGGEDALHVVERIAAILQDRDRRMIREGGICGKEGGMQVERAPAELRHALQFDEAIALAGRRALGQRQGARHLENATEIDRTHASFAPKRRATARISAWPR